MKIDINNETINAGRIRSQDVNASKNSRKSGPARTSTSQELQNISSKRTYIDAIVVSQMAQNFFQTAILISSRLKNIANEAILSGNMDQEKLGEALTGINVSLSELQKKEPTVSSAVQQYITKPGLPGMAINFSEVRDNITSLNEASSEVYTGKPDLKRIDRIKDNFFNNISKINDFINSFSVEFNLQGIQNTEEDVSGDLLNRTSRLVTDNPLNALNYQGHIIHNAVASLI